MRLRRYILAITLYTIGPFTGGPLTGGPAHAEVMLRDVPETGGLWQEARALVDAPAASVRTWLSDFEDWPLVFGDVTSIAVLGREGPVTVVKLVSRSFDRTLVLRFRPTSYGLSYTGGDEGDVRTEGKIFITSAGEARTDVVMQNVAHVGGILGALAPRSRIRERQRAKLRTDLTDLQRVAREQALRGALAR